MCNTMGSSSVGRSIDSDQSPTPPPDKKQRMTKDEPEEKKPVVKIEKQEETKPEIELKPTVKNVKVWTVDNLKQMLMPVWQAKELSVDIKKSFDLLIRNAGCIFCVSDLCVSVTAPTSGCEV